MKKIIDLLKSKKLYVCTFIIAFFIINIVYALNKVSPYGGNSLLCVDFYHQYGPMLGELYDRMRNFSSFIYSFNMAMGLPFFRNFLNYLSSPFNLIMLFFPRRGLLTSYSFIIGFKAVASVCTMVYFLSKKFKSKDLYLIPLGIIYGFSAYFSAYYWNIMWLDGMVMLPLITLGIEKIVNENKWKFYSITLAIMLLANYFIGYMICIFACVYFLFYLIYKSKLKKKELKKDLKEIFYKCFLFAFSSLIGGMLTFFLLLPMAYSMSTISATGGTMPTTQYYDFKLVDFIKGHLTGVNTTTFASDKITNPNISCGILSIALLFTYIINVEIPLKNKICYLSILGFFICAFFIPQLDFIIHAFHVPNDLPYRYSFIYSFILVIICSYSIMNIKKIKYPLLCIGYLILMIILYSFTLETWADITNNMIYINMILLTLYFIFYSALYYLNSLKQVFYFSICIVASIDVIISIDHNWDISQDLKGFYSDYNETEKLLEEIKENDDDLFYRIESINTQTLNDSSWYNYYGATTFSSMAYESLALLNYHLGLPGNQINSYKYIHGTPIYDLMFNIKYFIGEPNDYKRYTTVYSNEKKANKFDYNIGIGFGVNSDLENWNYNTGNPFEIQNDFISKSTGINDIFEKPNLVNTEYIYSDEVNTVIKLSYENNYDNYYLYSNSYSLKFMIIGSTLYYVDENYQDLLNQLPYGLEYTYIENYDEEYIINILSQDDTIDLIVGYDSYFSDVFNLYSINHERFVQVYEKLNDEKLNITDFKESRITGTITLNDNKMIYTSIPYDEGWHVYIDGEEVETYSLANSLLTFDSRKGKHKIEIKYKIPYFGLGTIMSLIAATIIVIDTFYIEKNNNKKTTRKKINKKEK